VATNQTATREETSTPDLSAFSDRELRDLLQDSTCRDRHDEIEIELENRDRAKSGLEPL
jgi:hypothetical protein